jgi:predicted RNase H-like nuclease (RuvC/YqgF family)
MVSAIIQTKAEIQKLIKLYNKLQAEAKTTTDPQETAQKVADAEKLVLKINTLQEQLAKLTVGEPKKPPVIKKNIATSNEKNSGGEAKSDSEKMAFEERIKRIESTQQQTRAQIEQLNRAKTELARLQEEAQKSAQVVAEERRLTQQKLPEITKLSERLKIREEEYVLLQKDFDAFRKQVNKDSDALREQRDSNLEKLKQLEKEKMNLLRNTNSRGDFMQGFMIGIGLGIVFLLALSMVVFLTPWLDDTVCYLKQGSNKCYFATAVTSTETGESLPP